MNKSEKSLYLSKSLPQEKSAIQRHVQTDRKRSRNPKYPKVLTTADPSSESTDESSASQESSPSSQHISDSIERLESTGLPHHSRTVTQNRHSHARKVTHRGDASLDRHSSLYRHDPFDSGSVPINEAVAGLLHYYMFYYHPSQWPNEMVMMRKGVYIFKGGVLSVVRTAIADRLAMYCLLGAAACRLQFVDRHPCPLIAGRENYYIREALQLMSQYIAGSNFDDEDQLRQFLACIIFLNSAEAYRGDMSAARTHLKAAVQVLNGRGGLASVKDEHLQGQLAMADLFLGCVKLETCLFNCTYDPGPAEDLRLSDSELQTPCTIGTASSLLTRNDNFIPPKLTAIVQELLETHTVKNRIATSSMSPTRATQVMHWITMRNMAIRNRLLAFKTTDARNHALRIALIMWSLLTMTVTGRAKTVKIMAPDLKRCLSENPACQWLGNEDAQLWILIVGFCCATEGSEALAWFRSECCNLSCCWVSLDPEITTASYVSRQLEVFQCNFLFDLQVQRTSTHTLAQDFWQSTR